MIYDIFIVFFIPFLNFPSKIVAPGVSLITSRIYLMIYLIGIMHIDKYVIKLAKKFKLLRKLIGLETQEGVE